MSDEFETLTLRPRFASRVTELDDRETVLLDRIRRLEKINAAPGPRS